MGVYTSLYPASDKSIEAFDKDPDALEVFLRDGNYFSIGKMQHGLHYLLTGSASDGKPPTCFLHNGQIPLEGASISAWAIDSGRVAEFYSFVRDFDYVTAIGKLDFIEMAAADVYPSDFWAHNDEDCSWYLKQMFEKLKEALESAYNNAQGLILTAC